MQANPLAVSSINPSLKNSQLEAAITRQLSNPLKDHRKGNSEPKKTTSLAHIVAAHSISSGSSKMNSNKIKGGRKSVASDYKGGRVMTQTEEPVLPRIPVPYQAQRRAISPARFENRAQNASSKSPIKQIPMSPEIMQQIAGEDIEYVERTPKQHKHESTPGGSNKPPRPLKEIKIDITNLVDEPVVTGNSTNNRASTSRNQAQNMFPSHRGEKGKPEKASTSKPWVPISTPQSAATQNGGKQRLSLATPKKEQAVSVKDNAKMLSLKTLLSEEELRQYGDRFPEEFEKTDFLGR